MNDPQNKSSTLGFSFGNFGSAEVAEILELDEIAAQIYMFGDQPKEV